MKLLNSELNKYSNLDNSCKKERRIHLIIFTLVWLVSSIMWYETVYEMCNMIGAIVSGTPKQALAELVRMLPEILLSIYLIYFNVEYHSAYVATSEKRIKKYSNISIVSYVFGLIICIYILIGYLTKFYLFIESNPTKLYPFDTFISGILLLAVGLLFFKKKNKKDYLLSNEYYSKKTMSWYFVVFYLAVLGATAMAIYSFTVLDFDHGNIFYNVMFILMNLLPIIMFVVYKYIYVDLKDEYKGKQAITYSIIFLVLNIIIFILYVVTVSNHLQVVVANASGLLPIEFTAKVNAFTYIYGIANILTPIISLRKGIKLSK